MKQPPNNALQRTRVRPAGGRSPLSLGPFGNRRSRSTPGHGWSPRLGPRQLPW
jgi:hypothetical protein